MCDLFEMSKSIAVKNMKDKDKEKRFEYLKNNNRVLYDVMIHTLLKYNDSQLEYNDLNYLELFNSYIKNEEDYKVTIELLYLIQDAVENESRKYTENLYLIGQLGTYLEMLKKIEKICKELKCKLKK